MSERSYHGATSLSYPTEMLVHTTAFDTDAAISDKIHVLHSGFKEKKEGNALFNNALNTFYLLLFCIRHEVKDHSDSEKIKRFCYFMSYSF